MSVHPASQATRLPARGVAGMRAHLMGKGETLVAQYAATAFRQRMALPDARHEQLRVPIFPAIATTAGGRAAASCIKRLSCAIRCAINGGSAMGRRIGANRGGFVATADKRMRCRVSGLLGMRTDDQRRTTCERPSNARRYAALVSLPGCTACLMSAMDVVMEPGSDRESICAEVRCCCHRLLRTSSAQGAGTRAALDREAPSHAVVPAGRLCR